MEKLYYSSYNAKTKYELVCKSTYSSDLLCYRKGSHKVFVDEVFDDWEGFDVRRRKRGKSSSLGKPEAPQVNIQGDSSV